MKPESQTNTQKVNDALKHAANLAVVWRQGAMPYTPTPPIAETAMVLADEVDRLSESLNLIATAKDRGFGIDYAQGCARAAISSPNIQGDTDARHS